MVYGVALSRSNSIDGRGEWAVACHGSAHPEWNSGQGTTVSLARFAYGEQKGEGIQSLVRYCRRNCGISAFAPVYLLVARHYAPKVRREGLSLRDIAEKHGLTKHAVDSAARWMAKHFASLELLAMQRLQAVFLADGLVEEAEDLGTLPAAPTPRTVSRSVVSRNVKRGAAEEVIPA